MKQKIMIAKVEANGTFEGLDGYLGDGWRLRIVAPLGPSILFRLCREGTVDSLNPSVMPAEQKLVARTMDADVLAKPLADPVAEVQAILSGSPEPIEYNGLAKEIEDGWTVQSAHPFGGTPGSRVLFVLAAP